ncbi:type IV toxin-antitoxin system AbiEi family antitoxin domain-containing protein [Microbacterium aoyamense]|uniref:Type IV toxin-antitoxin system AbiEi family antitoxin domain-containing protein n=1 Tax=Microbacterium aoyamense TaxID=344166 RepID=A0ABP5BCT6_9MICO|nr:DUF559 domain-containing protein [Microbacterium aoyamense]
MRVEIDLPVDVLLTRDDLRGLTMTARDIDAAVRAGALVRARQNVYLRGDSDSVAVTAARVGGRATCVSALARAGVFVHPKRNHDVHVHVPVNAGRLRRAGTARVHWSPTMREPREGSPFAEVIDALVHAAECQTPRAFIASVDSALHLRHLHPDDLDELFARLPRRLRRLRGLVDARAESGTETLVRLMLRGLGCRPDCQVQIGGVGRVDLVVDGWLVIECDSRAFHSGWEEQRRDRRRDLALAERGFVVLRVLAEDILFRPEVVLAAVKGLLRAAREARFAHRSGSSRPPHRR